MGAWRDPHSKKRNILTYFYLFLFFRRPRVVLHWDKQGISIRISDRYEITERAPGRILTPRNEVYSLIFYLFFRRSRTILHRDRQDISIKILNRYKIRERAPGRILTPRNEVYSLIFYLFLFFRRPLIILRWEKQGQYQNIR